MTLGWIATTRWCSRPPSACSSWYLATSAVTAWTVRGEGGAIGGGREPYLAVHRERGELLLGPVGAGDQVADIADELGGERQQPAGGQPVRRPGRVGGDRRQRGRRDHVRGGRGLQQPLGHVALAALLHQLHQPVLLQRPQVVVDLLPRQPERRRRAWSPSAARPAGPAAGPGPAPAPLRRRPDRRSLLHRSCDQCRHPTKFFVKKNFLVGMGQAGPGRGGGTGLQASWAERRLRGGRGPAEQAVMARPGGRPGAEEVEAADHDDAGLAAASGVGQGVHHVEHGKGGAGITGPFGRIGRAGGTVEISSRQRGPGSRTGAARRPGQAARRSQQVAARPADLDHDAPTPSARRQRARHPPSRPRRGW